MAVDVDYLNANNVNNININFQRTKDALQEVLGRDGDLPNQMNADLDLNSNDILNVKLIQVEDITINGTDSTGFLEQIEEQVAIATAQADAAEDSAEAAYQAQLAAEEAAAGAGVSDGDKGDITVSGDGTVWTIDNDVVEEVNLSSDVRTKLNLSRDLWAEDFGVSTTNTALANSDAIDLALAAAASQNKQLRIGGGNFSFSRQMVIPHGVRFIGSGNNAENDIPDYGPTVLVKAFNGSYLIRLSNSAVIARMDIIPGSGNTGGGVEWYGARARAEDVSCFNLVGTAFSIEASAPNMNLWSSVKCRAVDITGAGFVIAQFKPAQAYANGITLVLDAEYYNASNGRNYKVLAAGVGQVTSSGTLAADIAAHPTWWALSNFPFGAPDTNGGFMQEYEASRCSGAGLVLQNTSDNVCHVVIQNCGQGVVFDYNAFGNRVTGYTEANTTNDVYFGQTAVGNEMKASALVPPVVSDDSDVGARSKNVFFRKIDDATGNAGYMANKVEAWSGEGETYFDWFQGPNFVNVARLAGYVPSGSAGRLELRIKLNGGALRRMATFYPEGRADWWGSAADNTFHAFYDNGNVQRGSISNTGATTTYATSSDQNWKDDKGVLDNAVAADIIRLISIHNFKWKDEHGGSDDIGAFAQELYKIYPQAVRVGGEDENGIYQPWQVDYSKLVIPLVSAWQNIDERLKALEND